MTYLNLLQVMGFTSIKATQLGQTPVLD